MRLAADSASYIDFIYTLKPDSYLMNFEIKATGMTDKLANTNYVDIDWSQRCLLYTSFLFILYPILQIAENFLI